MIILIETCLGKKSECKGNTEACSAKQPRPNSSGCTELINREYGEETCCPNGEAEENFASTIATCYNNSWMIMYTDVCFNPNLECKV